MIAAAVYSPSFFRDAMNIGMFFEAKMKSPYGIWWQQAKISLIRTDLHSATEKTLSNLEKMIELVDQHRVSFLDFLPQCQEELVALLWWKLGQAYSSIHDHLIALEWSEKALTRLGHIADLKKEVVNICMNVDYQLTKQGKFADRIPYLQRAIELQPDAFYAHSNLGSVFLSLGNYKNAVQIYTKWLEIDPWGGIDGNIYRDRAEAHIHLKKYKDAIQDLDYALQFAPYTDYIIRRGDVYRYLKEYQQAIVDYSGVLEGAHLDPAAYGGRGLCYLYLGDVLRAKADYSHRDELNRNTSDSSCYLLMSEWVNMGKKRADMETAERLEQIAIHAQWRYISCVGHAIALGLHGRLKEGLAELEKAIELEPAEWKAYFWKGMYWAYYYQGRYRKAWEAIEKSLELDLPPPLLTPLYWLKEERPDFFEQYAKQLLETHKL